MKLTSTVLFSTILSAGITAAAGAVPSTGPVTLKEHVRPLLEQYCFDCHNDKKQKGDVNLLPVADNTKLEENRKVWEQVAQLIESREMPPEKKPQPTEEQRELLIKYIDGQLSKAECLGPK